MVDPLADGLPLAELTAPVRVRSRLLDDEFWLVPDGLSTPPEGVCYTVTEMCALLSLGLSADRLRAVHAVKKGVDGTFHDPTRGLP